MSGLSRKTSKKLTRLQDPKVRQYILNQAAKRDTSVDQLIHGLYKYIQREESLKPEMSLPELRKGRGLSRLPSAAMTRRRKFLLYNAKGPRQPDEGSPTDAKERDKYT